MVLVTGLTIAILGAFFQSPTILQPDEVLSQLSKVRLDKKQILTIRDVTIRRDVLTIAFNRGTIAFLEPVNGKVTGAVFIGSGEIVAIPPDPIEKQQVHKFTGTPLINESFQSAVFRFSDNTYEEIRKEIARHAEEEVSAEEAAEFDSWETLLAERASVLNLRLLADFLEPASRPLFLGELKGDKLGWFNVTFDMRAPEEVSMFQVREIGAISFADVWASFNQRSEARNPEAVAHENKAPIDILSYEIEGTSGPDSGIDAKVSMRVKARTDGARVLTFDLAPAMRLSSVSVDAEEPAPHYQRPNAKGFTTVLTRPLKPNQEVTLRFAYAGPRVGDGPWRPWQHQQTIPSSSGSLPLTDDRSVLDYSGRKVSPASYHDQWLVEGLSRYLAIRSTEAKDPAGARNLLSDIRNDIRPVEQAGPIWLGQRIVSTVTPDAYRLLSGKGAWVVHMLRVMLRQTGPDPDAKFMAMLEEFTRMYDGRTASTWDFKHLAEKYAGKKLDWFFDQWVFAIGLPAYSTDYKIESSGDEFTIEGTLTQTGVPEGFTMSVPLYADGEYLGAVEVADPEERFRFKVGKRPERLTIDPEMTILTSTTP